MTLSLRTLRSEVIAQWAWPAAVILAMPLAFHFGQAHQKMVKLDHCLANFRLLSQAISMYRSDYGGLDIYADASTAGLPPSSSAYSGYLNWSSIECSGGGLRRKGYYYYPQPSGRGGTAYGSYLKRAREQAILFADPNHNFPPLSPFAYRARRQVFGLRLDGSVATRTARGKWLTPTWWDQSEVLTQSTLEK
jgi:hypothetical protein